MIVVWVMGFGVVLLNDYSLAHSIPLNNTR
jgi:hypothetical protein